MYSARAPISSLYSAAEVQLLVPERSCLINGDHSKDTTMRKTILSILAASLVVMSAVQTAAAGGRYTHKSDYARAAASQQFRSADDSLASPAVEQQDWSDYSEGHVISAPAGQ
jgi:hypothetical protein